jgi:psp operon transcriptional activator
MDGQSPSLIGQSAAFLEALEHASRAAALDKPVLVIGERGSGKELIASRLHYLSARWDEAYVRLNCATLSEGLLETELFGHEAGAFTGATRQHAGRFERADGGSLFLDELATISQRMQEQLLRAVEYGEFERVGGDRTLQADVRVIAATNADLPAMARRGEFRPDLLDRLAFDVVRVPPLRERRDDILPLAEHFAMGMTRELERPFFPGFADSAIEAMLAHDWPGNVRELKNAVERSVYRSADPETPVSELVLHPFGSPWRRVEDAPNTENELSDPKDDIPSPSEPAAAVPGDIDAALAELEKKWLNRALAESRYSQRATARRLGLSYDQLRARLRKHGIDPRN